MELRVTMSTVYPSATLSTICDISWSSSNLHTCTYNELHLLFYDRFIAFQFKTSSSDIKQCCISLKVEATLLEMLLVETSTVTVGSRVSFVRGVIWLGVTDLELVSGWNKTFCFPPKVLTDLGVHPRCNINY